MQYKYNNCNICDSLEKERLFSMGEHKIVKCSSCGLIYIENPLNPAETKAYYEKYYSGSASPTAKSCYAEGEQFRIREAANRLDRIGQIGSILDIGCGMGFFVKTAGERGIKAIGIDIAENAIKYGQSRGLNLRVGDILDIDDFVDESFDAITLWATIEHLHNPKKTLEKIYKLLKPKGLLVIETGDIGSYHARLFGRKWRLIKTDHNFYYSSETLNKLLEKTGFVSLRTEYDGFVESIVTQLGLQNWVLDRFIKSPDNAKKKASSLKEKINRFAGRIKLGDVMIKYAKKNIN